jgi:hypothetical protein
MKKSLIIIDIQPFYHQYHRHITPNLLSFIKEEGFNYENILWFFNAEEVGINETIVDMQEYIFDFGIFEDEDFELITFIDKYYAFFRNWMDSGIDEDFIKYVVKHMIREDVVDSRDLDEDDLKILIETYYNTSIDDFMQNYHNEYDLITSESIHIPHFKWDKIKELREVDICGGG